ncbi:SLBB domain-containing protein [Novosphingobium sp. JCM 18896]|uniref:SLBB domain-containing protein n=1 Tax=Novosphingobium sp. JCM 18896 TaxID=2989731 RepID=UPI002223833A|nr:SLBB domain-containing protein [Novosphingobium sp. JCM 18896]MCW1429334.1 SLBB domain-containing protein [Novosphingobium sp. JCM 18896]
MGSPLDPSQTNQRTQTEQDNRSSSSAPPSVYVDPTGSAQTISPTQIKNDGLASLPTVSSNSPNPRVKPAAPPNEFERYVANSLGRSLPRFGAGLLLPDNRDYALPATATVPPGYILSVGDTVAISLIGSTEGSIERQIDTDGKIFLPSIGSVMLAGVRYADLKDRVSAAIGRQYRGYEVTVSVRQLRGIRVYVTGFANDPGAYSVNSLSTMVNAVLAAGGPSAGGSFRSVQLYRRGNLVGEFDLYDLVRRGDRSNDQVLQNEDVLFIPPLGKQVAITGSVNEEAIYEAKPGETMQDMLRIAGGPNNLADETRVMLYRASDLSSSGAIQITAGELASQTVRGGDLIQVLSEGSLQRPLAGQSVLVRIEGEVNKPGNYFVPANSTMADIMNQAGGTTPRAFVFGTRLERNSVRVQQREAFREAIEQLEMSLAAAPLTAGQTLDAGERANQLAGARAVLERLRAAEPDGRVVLDIPPSATAVPETLLMENNDRIVIPPRATTVGVFGSVYRPASFYLDERAGRPMKVSAYIDRAGGPMRSADKKSIFVVRANGSVLSRRNGALNAHVLPGDVIFVPVRTQSTSVWTKIREISTIIFQMGVSAAALAAIK